MTYDTKKILSRSDESRTDNSTEKSSVRHAEIARELFLGGSNCAQSVFCAYCDVTGYDREQALRLASSFGGGMGRMREVCGALSAVYIIIGILYGYSTPGDDEEKGKHYALVQDIAERFKRKNSTIICRELLKELEVGSLPTPTPRTAEYYKIRPCARFVMDACDILDDIIAEKGVQSQEKQ